MFGLSQHILTRILRGWKTKLVYGLLNWWDLISYQTQITTPNTKPNLFNQIYETET